MKILAIQQLYGGYGNETVLSDVSLNIHKGEFFGILGPNGSGKTTLLKMISGVLPFKSGTILLKGQPIQTYSPKQLAKVIAVLSQHTTEAFSYTVKETVSLGRYAHQKGFFKEWSDKDEEMVQKVMNWTGDHYFPRSTHPTSFWWGAPASLFSSSTGTRTRNSSTSMNQQTILIYLTKRNYWIC